MAGRCMRDNITCDSGVIEKSERGFTLIELMVSIGIISLLIGILLPSISAAVESARSVRCRVNLHSLITGLQMYRDDNRGDIPWATFNPINIDNPEPYLILSSYIGVEVPSGEMGQEIDRVDPFVCPSDRENAIRTGYSYSYNPSSFMQVSSEDWGREDMNYILRLYTQYQEIGNEVFPKGLPVFVDVERFHIDRDRWSGLLQTDHTGYNFAYLDGSVRVGD